MMKMVLTVIVCVISFGIVGLLVYWATGSALEVKDLTAIFLVVITALITAITLTTGFIIGVKIGKSDGYAQAKIAENNEKQLRQIILQEGYNLKDLLEVIEVNSIPHHLFVELQRTTQLFTRLSSYSTNLEHLNTDSSRTISRQVEVQVLGEEKAVVSEDKKQIMDVDKYPKAANPKTKPSNHSSQTYNYFESIIPTFGELETGKGLTESTLSSTGSQNDTSHRPKLKPTSRPIDTSGNYEDNLEVHQSPSKRLRKPPLPLPKSGTIGEENKLNSFPIMPESDVSNVTDGGFSDTKKTRPKRSTRKTVKKDNQGADSEKNLEQ